MGYLGYPRRSSLGYNAVVGLWTTSEGAVVVRHLVTKKREPCAMLANVALVWVDGCCFGV